MTTKQLESRISTRWGCYGTHETTIEYRGKRYTCRTNNTLATDRISGYADEVSDKTVKGFYTYKGALKALWDECKRVNQLGEYNV